MRSLNRRVEKLEDKARIGSSELEQRLQARFEADAAERGPEWVKRVEEVSERFRRAVEEHGECGERDIVGDRAVRVALDEFHEVCHENRPAWPPEFRQIYEEDPKAMPLHDCEDCGLSIPCRPGHNAPNRTGPAAVIEPFYRYFDQCPACEGRVGYSAYFLKQGRGE